MIKLPLSLVLWARRKGIIGPAYHCIDVPESPLEHELQPLVVHREVRGGYPKWAHLSCPRCGEHIQLPIGGSKESWRLSVDWLHRPTLSPSIWELQSCRAHFIMQVGKLLWCRDDQ